ncbi:unnamed protein product [Ambrosiozyma monospora]|uniref:Unnamed protein product n=1 Tax=Ambrosiozyma monospora TaxID=43982 RepID=A0A9W7DE61_AMBMO|nr:unnamed protein product [Ambrosiozyma monospora]
MKVDTALKFKIIPTSKDQFPSQEEQLNAMEDFKKENPMLLEFYPNLTNTSIIYINTVGLHPANTFLSGPTEESRKQKLEEESQKLITKLTATTFQYATNLTFQLEHIDYENTNDIIVANILIPVRLRPLQRYIINDILPPADFKIILTKSPAALDQAKLDLSTAQYNVQVLGRVEKDRTVSIPNLFPYKAAKSKMRQAIVTTMPSQILKYEPISVRMRTRISFCKLCRSSEHRAVDCPEAKECLRCFRKGHHHLQCHTNLKFVDDPRKIERDADNALKSKKQQMTILQNVAKTKKAYNERNEEALKQHSHELEKVRTPIVTPASPDAFTLVSPSKKRRRGYPSPARHQPTTSIQPLKEHSFNAYTLLPDEEEYHTPTLTKLAIKTSLVGRIFGPNLATL